MVIGSATGINTNSPSVALGSEMSGPQVPGCCQTAGVRTFELVKTQIIVTSRMAMTLLLNSTAQLYMHACTHTDLVSPAHMKCYNVFAVLHNEARILRPDVILNKLRYSHPDFHLRTFPHLKNSFEYTDTFRQPGMTEAMTTATYVFIL